MPTLTAADIRNILEKLDKIDELTGLLRRAHMDVPYRPISAAIGAAGAIRQKLLRVALTDVTVEPAVVDERRAA